jgi:hypothetical protein
VKGGVWSSRGSLIGYEPHLMKWRSQVRIPPLPTLAWSRQKKKKKVWARIKKLKKNYLKFFIFGERACTPTLPLFASVIVCIP